MWTSVCTLSIAIFWIINLTSPFRRTDHFAMVALVRFVTFRGVWYLSPAAGWDCVCVGLSPVTCFWQPGIGVPTFPCQECSLVQPPAWSVCVEYWVGLGESPLKNVSRLSPLAISGFRDGGSIKCRFSMGSPFSGREAWSHRQ